MSQEKNPFEFWQKRDELTAKGRISAPGRPGLQHRRRGYPPKESKPPNKKGIVTPPPRPPDASELFRPVRISSVPSHPGNVAELARQFERSSSSPTASPHPPPRRMPSPSLLGRREDEERGRPALSAPPTLEKRPQKKSSRDKSRNKPAPSVSSFISHLDGPLDLAEVTAQLEEVQRYQKQLDEDVPQRLLRSSPVVTHPTRARLSSTPAQQLLRENSGALHDPIRREHAEFWSLVHRVVAEVAPTRSTYMGSPMISHQQAPVVGRPRRQRSVYCKSPGNVKVAMETTLVNRDTAVVLQCRVVETAAEVIRKGLGMLAHSSALSSTSPEGYQLKVCGKDEYLDSERRLIDFEYVNACLKMSSPVHVVLMERSLVKQVVTSLVVVRAPSVTEDQSLSLQELNSLLDSYFSKSNDSNKELATPPVNYTKLSQSVISCIRLLCERMSFIEPFSVLEAVFNLRRACKAATTPDEFSATIAVEMETVEGGWSCVSFDQLKEMQEAAAADISAALETLERAVQGMVELYCSTLHCDYEPVWCEDRKQARGRKPHHSLQQVLRVKLLALHRVFAEERHSCDTYQVEVCVFHGGRALSKKAYSPPARITQGFFPMVTWNKWINLSLPIAQLPREARVCFTLLGLTLPGTGLGYGGNKEVLGWVATRLFDTTGELCSGPQLLAMWRDDSPADPTDTCYSNTAERRSMVLEVLLEEFEYSVEYGPITVPSPFPHHHLPPNVSKQLQEFASKDRFDQLGDEELRQLWQHRAALPSLLNTIPRGLPALLQAIPDEEQALTRHLLADWPMAEPIYGLELLDSQYANGFVRAKAVEWLGKLPIDDLIDLLPQLTQSLKYDCYLTSEMTKLLLSRSMVSPRLAHHFYWNLHTLTKGSRFGWRYGQLLHALTMVCGEEMSMELCQQAELVETLRGVAATVKASKDAQRQTTLVNELKRASVSLPPVFRLPLNPALQCCDIDIQNCSFFNSKTVPLKLSFRNADPFGSSIDVIFKVGDDLRQDMLTLQMIRLMEKLWLRAGLDLRMLTYQCLATGPEEGMVEMVPDSATLRQIQTEHGLTGSFRDKPLSEWLMRHNPTDADWKLAIENFTYSCAGYCVATYVLGICDRHNDNIMVCKTGHMFHIDFGRILGNAQMFGSIKRDRVPFVLTPDMAYVINAGDKPSARFQKFTDLCCTAYNELRKYSHVLLSIMSLMLSSDLPELSSADDVQYVRDALLPQSSEEEATYIFTKHIEASLSSMATQINFFIHNLAQFKFSSTTSSEGLLSFSPTSFSIATDGKVDSAVVVAYHKKYYPSKYIVYQVQVTRVDPALPVTTIFRRYSEFNELHKKLSECFLHESLPQLPGKTFLPGQSTTRETSERRQAELSFYLKELLYMDSRISESDVIYTFLHCLLRDEQDLLKMREDESSTDSSTAGRVKLDLQYSEEQERLSIMVRHVRELVPRDGTESMDPYVKLYLLPDPKKASKQKTKIARKTLNPTYNQMFHYPLRPEHISQHCLQLTVWDASSLLSKECLGCVLIQLQPLHKDLIRGMSTWFELQPASLINR